MTFWLVLAVYCGPPVKRTMSPSAMISSEPVVFLNSAARNEFGAFFAVTKEAVAPIPVADRAASMAASASSMSSTVVSLLSSKVNASFRLRQRPLGSSCMFVAFAPVRSQLFEPKRSFPKRRIPASPTNTFQLSNSARTSKPSAACKFEEKVSCFFLSPRLFNRGEPSTALLSSASSSKPVFSPSMSTTLFGEISHVFVPAVVLNVAVCAMLASFMDRKDRARRRRGRV